MRRNWRGGFESSKVFLNANLFLETRMRKYTKKINKKKEAFKDFF